MTTPSPAELALTGSELQMLCEVAHGHVGWRSKGPAQDHFYALHDQFQMSSRQKDALRVLSLRAFIYTTAPWVLVTDKGRHAIGYARDLAAVLHDVLTHRWCPNPGDIDIDDENED